jgi:histidyl-tRNA synthetase
MQIQRCKGCRDLTGEEMLRFRSVEGAFQDISKSYGYTEVRTPTLEYLHLFTSAGTLTPGMLRRVYSFLDWDGWSGERVVLKPDATIPVARLYAETMASRKLVSRLSYVTNSFVFEETGTKARERWQCGAELIGSGSSIADAELVSFASDAIKKMGLQHLELSNLGLSHTEQDEIFDRILDGKTEALDGLQAEKPWAVDALKLLLGTKGNSSGFLKNLRALFAADIPEVQDALEEFIATIDLLEAMGMAYEIDFTSGKGFEYYTGFIFRLFAEGVNVGGGGRYDRLVGMMSETDVPAGGFALYIDRLAALINIDNLYIPVSARVSLDIEPAVMKEAVETADLLRGAGCVVMFALQGQAPENCGWEITIKSAAPRFTVLNCGTGESSACETAFEAFATVGCN